MEMVSVIYKVLSNTATIEEAKKLSIWVGQSVENHDEYENIKLLWLSRNNVLREEKSSYQAFEKIRQRIHTWAKKKNQRRVVFIAMFFSILIYIYISSTWASNEPLVFNNEPLPVVIETVESKYDIKINIEDESILSCSITGTFSKADIPAHLVSSIASAIGAQYQVLSGTEYRLIGESCR